MKRASVRPSVCLFHHSTADAACGGFAADAVRAGDIDRQRRPPGAQQQQGRGTALSSVSLDYETVRIPPLMSRKTLGIQDGGRGRGVDRSWRRRGY